MNTHHSSRQQLLYWVNTVNQSEYKKIEDLHTGTAYCQMMDKFFPNCINVKRIRMDAKLHHDSLYNLKLLQETFDHLHIDKPIPIDRLLLARFQDNLEFLQWFYKTFEARRGAEQSSTTGVEETTAEPADPAQSSQPTESIENEPQITVDSLKSEIENVGKDVGESRKHCDFYYKKLARLEQLVNENRKCSNLKQRAFVNSVHKKLYELPHQVIGIKSVTKLKVEENSKTNSKE